MSFEQNANMEHIDAIIDFENGSLSDEEIVTLFQSLIDSGQVWQMQGSYGRQAIAMLRSGQCMLSDISQCDYYGNYIPSRNEVEPGAIGSKQFVESQSGE
jgi:hypothetical protein